MGMFHNQSRDIYFGSVGSTLTQIYPYVVPREGLDRDMQIEQAPKVALSNFGLKEGARGHQHRTSDLLSKEFRSFAKMPSQIRPAIFLANSIGYMIGDFHIADVSQFPRCVSV